MREKRCHNESETCYPFDPPHQRFAKSYTQYSTKTTVTFDLHFGEPRSLVPVVATPSSTIVVTAVIASAKASTILSVAAPLMTLTTRLMVTTKPSWTGAILRGLLSVHLWVQVTRVTSITLLALSLALGWW